jgi:energy-coupling factor transporter ATP-binding protein EcfA2
MRFRDRPLLPTDMDAQLYVRRPFLEAAVLVPLREGRNVLLLGEAGAGKTTFLRYAANELGHAGRQVVIVNAGLAVDVGELLALVESELDVEADVGVARSSGAGAASLLAAARRLRRAEPATILVDGLLDPHVAFDLFGRLRDELWELGHVWLVTVRPRDSAPLRSPPADAFWGAIVEIPPLSVSETTELLRRGLDEDEYRIVDAERMIAGAHPRTVIREAQTTLAGGVPAATTSRVEELKRHAGALGRSEEMAMVELIGIGHPTSAHDPELLQRLGWSRPYAQRMLSKLEDEELVRSMPERDTDRPGRPRKLYEPVWDRAT